MIELRNVTKEYSKGNAALNGVSVKIERGEFVFIVGDSGSGKSTLIRLIMKELNPTEGTIIVNGQNLNRMKHRHIAKYRRGLGVVFQDFRLLKDRNIYENIAFALRVTETPTRVIKKKVPAALSLVGLAQKYKSFPKELSGGEQQRVAIARALVNEPAILLCDEPTGNLDPTNSWEIMSILKEANERGTTVLVVTHNQEIVNEMSERVITMKQGVIVSDEQKCGICSKVCQAGAIDYEQQDEIVTEKYGAIVVATGFDMIKLDKYDEYAYSQSKDVITSLELERIMNAAGPTGGHLERLSDGKAPKEIVFIQCVGSRCADDRGKSYCSKVCCMYTAKHAMLIRDKYPDTNVTVFYIDVRTPGKNFDEFYRRAVEDYGVNYIKGQVGKVIPQPDGKLLVQGADLIDNKQILKEADMVVLAAAIEPNPDVRKIATMLTASIDTNNFLTEAHAKLRPVESPTAGIFLSGVCQGPKDIPETVSQAGAAAVKAIGLLAKDKLLTNPCTAHSDELLCNGCSQCANVCPYGAITYEDKEVNDHGIRETRRIAIVNDALCQGCGACTVTCPSGAMDLQGFSNRQILAEVDAICR